MAGRIFGNKIINCGIGISIPKDADIDIAENEISACNTAIELRDPPTFLENLGLKRDTPPEMVVAVLKAISNGANDKDSIENEVKSVGLLDYLSGTANLTTIVSAFYGLSQSPLLQQALALFQK